MVECSLRITILLSCLAVGPALATEQGLQDESQELSSSMEALERVVRISGVLETDVFCPPSVYF